MKKFLVILLSLAILFSFSACSDSDTSTGNLDVTPTANAENSTPTPNDDATPTAQATPDSNVTPTPAGTPAPQSTATPTAKPTATATPAPSNLNPKTDLQMSVEYMGNFRLDGDLHASALQFEGDGCMVTDRMFSLEVSEDLSVQYQGKTYYSVGGGFTPYRYKLTDTEVIITTVYYQDDTDVPSIKAMLLENGTLKITYSTIDNYPVGLVLSTNISDVING